MANNLQLPAVINVDHVWCPTSLQPLLSVGLTSNSLNRSNDVGLRNREENGVLPERCDPFPNGDEELCNQVQCTESFPLLEDEVKRRKPAPSTIAVGWGLDCLPATGRSPVLLRYLTQP